jgi:hypothetical protein
MTYYEVSSKDLNSQTPDAGPDSTKDKRIRYRILNTALLHGVTEVETVLLT